MRPDARHATALVVVVSLALCVSCCATLLGFNYLAPRRSPPFGYFIQLCVGVNTIPHLRIGVTWIAPYISSMPPVMLQNPWCATVPWLPFLPPRGGFAFPP